ncbi:hypothetical protein [Embleya sp. MST-111070]
MERRCRYFTDIAAHALVTGLLVGGRTTPERHTLATRCAIA